MKKYLIVIKQVGEGCDYMIGCAQKTITLYADNIEQASKRFALMIGPEFDDNDVDWTEDYGGYYDDTQLESATIYEVDIAKAINLDEIYKALRIKEDIETAEYVEEIERKEFERLKNKFR